MSFAYQALVIFVFALPGILFRQRVSTAGRYRQQRLLADELAHSLVWAILWHTLWIWGCSFLPVPPVDVGMALMHAMGQFGPGGGQQSNAIKAVTTHLPYVVAYFVTITISAGVAGQVLSEAHESESWWFQWVGWLQDHEPLKQRHREWEKFLKGESDDKNVLVVRLLTMIIELGKTPYLFIGRLEGTDYGPDGNPERFLLSSVSRRALLSSDDNPNEAKNQYGMYPIVGKSFLVRASEVKTLNIIVRDLSTIEEVSFEKSRDTAAEDAEPLQVPTEVLRALTTIVE